MDTTRSIPHSVFDALLSTSMAALLVYLAVIPSSEGLPHEGLTVLTMFYLGLLMTCAYFAPRRLYILRALNFFSEHLSYPRARYMSLVYAVAFFSVAAFYFVRGINAG